MSCAPESEEGSVNNNNNNCSDPVGISMYVQTIEKKKTEQVQRVYE